MEFSRLPRFNRASTVPSIELTHRDREIIRLVHRHRFLRSSQILALIGASPQQLLRRLQLLYHHGYLERPRAQIDYYDQGGSHHMVYGLGNRGAALLKQELGGAFRQLPRGEENLGAKRLFLEHTLLVAEVMISVELACRQKRIRLLTEDDLAPPGLRRSFEWRVNTTSASLSVVPDRVFALEVEREGGETDRAYFFLEADRGTMPVIRTNCSQTSFYRKLLAYEATWSQLIHRTRFGFDRFRVLTVTTNAARVQSLIDACAKLKRGRGLFLFADKTILDTSGSILSPVWRTAKQGQTTSLLA
jgi:DNA-binding Lrp family transcriptional regulator